MLQQLDIHLNQRKLIEYKISFKQAMLISYIFVAMNSTKTKHIAKDDVAYVWIQHSKVLEDLPYIDTSLPRLRQLLTDLVDKGLLKTAKEINDLHGSKVYYAITEKCEQLIYEPEKDEGFINDPEIKDESPKMETHIEPRVSKNGDSDNNKIISKEIISKDIPKRDIRKSETPANPKLKMDLHSKCVRYIMEYTDYFKLQKALVRYLDVLLEISRSEKKPIYYNMFIGKLNRLNTFPEEDRLEIVELATSNGWKNFYALNNDDKPSKKRFKDEAVSECYTEEELANLKKLEEERKKNGLRTKF